MDDEPDVAELVAAALSLDGHRVETVNSATAALDRLLDRAYDLVFSDMKMALTPYQAVGAPTIPTPARTRRLRAAAWPHRRDAR